MTTRSLWQDLSATADLSNRWLWGADASVSLEELRRGSSFVGRLDRLRGRSVLLTVSGQLSAALALIELDGVARRMILCPPGLPADHLTSIMAMASVDAVVGDGTQARYENAALEYFTVTARTAPAEPDRRASEQTEWILLTSGTTGVPKLVVHTLQSLTEAIRPRSRSGKAEVWSTFYDIRRYGGLQILLRALLGGRSMVLSSDVEPIADFLSRLGGRGVTHISGTPSHWRRALMSPSARKIRPRYVRLSGEIADQAILDQLHVVYPEAHIAHAFASTEAGVAFAVEDGLAGFPAEIVGGQDGNVELRVKEGSLQIRSPRTAARYLGRAAEPLRQPDGYVDTGDLVELRSCRYHFAGRRDGVINIGGAKVHPEEIEAVINRHPRVRMSLVKGRRNPITGTVVVADIVVNSAAGDAPRSAEAVQAEILETCQRHLLRHKVPAVVRVVSSLPVAASGKLARS